jgi:CMP-N-acetylneuraminic acid synthetase|tara:strand:- start:434 stop:1129 length:696 start_codon:yes stop_codon:yes gene_type:complete
MKNKSIVLICARKGSKGIKHKNLRKIGSQHLFAHSIKIAKKIKNIFKIYVSSDSKKILNISKRMDVNVIKRSKKLSGDKISEILVWKDAINFFKKEHKFLPKILIVLPPTSPLRNLRDVNASIKKFKTKNYNIILMGYKSNHNPFFNMLAKNKNGYYNKLFSKKIYRRQDAPALYNISTACYVIDVKYLLITNDILKSKVGMVTIPRKRSIDIDDNLDLFFARKIYESKQK